MSDRVMVQVRLPKDLVKRLDHWRIDQNLFRDRAVERLLTQMLDQQEETACLTHRPQ